MMPHPAVGGDGGGAALVARAVRTWSEQLIDVGHRNSLLFFRDLKRGTLDLAEGEGTDRAVLGRLLDGATVRMSALFPAVEQQPDVMARARAVRAKARENYEERGLLTLFVAVGMATWSHPASSAVPQAPVLARRPRSEM